MMRTLCLLALVASSAGAQIVEIQLREQGTGTPIAGAVVRLLREDREMSQALTNASGTVSFRAPQYGVYKVRVNRIGFRSVTVDSIIVASDGTVLRELTMSTTPFVLPSIETQTKSACGPRLDDGATISLLWEQIATALRANLLTQTVWQIPLNVQRFRRNVTLEDSVFRDLIVGSFLVHGPPFAAADPVLLEKNGFVTEDKEGTTTFNAPDAATLLSDAFVSSHCFSAVPGRSGLMGLAFEPAPKRRLSDVEGTLWIDQASSELRSLDYVYTNLHNGMERVTLGGHVDFKRLSTGAWIVSYWYIRMPKIHVIPADVHFYAGQQITRPEMRDVDYYIEEGGRVTVIDATTTIVTVATLIGTVSDSSTGGGLAGAVIHLAGEADSAVTDSAGHYRLVTRSAGTHTATVSHAKFGLIADSSTKEVYLSLGASARTDFAVPSATTFIREFCGKAENTSSGIVGRALSAKGEGLEGYDIRVTWAVGGGGQVNFLEEHAESGPNGIFVVCSLPPKQEFTLYLRKQGHEVGKAYLRLEAGDYRWVDLTAAPPPTL